MKIYTCSMHPEIEQNKPGKCPKCGGMALVPKEEVQTHSMDHAEKDMGLGKNSWNSYTHFL